MAKQESYIQMGAYFLNGRRYNDTSGNYEDEFTPLTAIHNPTLYGMSTIKPKKSF